MVEKWEQTAVKHKGAMRRYMMRVYGKEAFNKDDTIKGNYLYDALKNAEKRHETTLEKRIVLARTFKKQKERE